MTDLLEDLNTTGPLQHLADVKPTHGGHALVQAGTTDCPDPELHPLLLSLVFFDRKLDGSKINAAARRSKTAVVKE